MRIVIEVRGVREIALVCRRLVDEVTDGVGDDEQASWAGLDVPVLLRELDLWEIGITDTALHIMLFLLGVKDCRSRLE